MLQCASVVLLYMQFSLFPIYSSSRLQTESYKLKMTAAGTGSCCQEGGCADSVEGGGEEVEEVEVGEEGGNVAEGERSEGKAVCKTASVCFTRICSEHFI